MYTIILKITDPHGWVIADDILNHYSSFLGINYSKTGCLPLNILNIPKEQISLQKLKEGIIYWFEQEKYKDKNNLLILTEDTEKENQDLVNMLKEINITRKECPFNFCIIICNDFMCNNGG